MTNIISYLNFKGNTAEAMQYYAAILGGQLFMQKVSESPIANQCPTNIQNQIMHATLSKNGIPLLSASDMIGAEGFVHGNNTALLVNCSSEAEIKNAFTSFAADGKVIDELKAQFWGAIFGVVTDKFGIRWMFNYNTNENQ